MNSAERLKLLVEERPAILWVYDEVNGRMLYVNLAAEEILGHERQLFYDRPAFWFELIHPADKALASAENHVMRTEKLTIQYQTRFRNAEGGYVTLCTTVKTILDPNGRIVRTEGAAIPKTQAMK